MTKPRFKILLSSTREGMGKIAEEYRDFQIDTRSIWTVGNSQSANILSEYDAVIIDHTKYAYISPARKTQAAAYSAKPGSVFVFILNKFVSDNYPNTNYDFFRAYLKMDLPEWGAMYLHDYSGESFEIKAKGNASAFAKYLNAEKRKWDLALKKDYALYGGKAVPLACNAEGDIVAFTPTGLEDRAFFVPWLHNEETFWECVNHALLSTAREAEPPPAWTEAYTVPGLAEEKKEIAGIEQEISKLQLERVAHEEVRDTLEFVRDTLLFRDGKVLQNTVRDILKWLGLDAKDGAKGEEDLSFVENGERFVVEIKGLKKSATENHLAELHKHRGTYEAANGVKAKAVLIVNPWRTLPLEERDTSSQRSFPDNVLQKADVFEVALLTTQQLFVAYCQQQEEFRLSGKFEQGEFVKKLFETKGIFQGLNDIDNYRVRQGPSE